MKSSQNVSRNFGRRPGGKSVKRYATRLLLAALHKLQHPYNNDDGDYDNDDDDDGDDDADKDNGGDDDDDDKDNGGDDDGNKPRPERRISVRLPELPASSWRRASILLYGGGRARHKSRLPETILGLTGVNTLSRAPPLSSRVRAKYAPDDGG